MRDAVRSGVLTTRTPRRFTSRCAAWASSRDVRVSPLRGRARLRRVGLRHVEEVPDEDGVVVRAAHDLKLVELQTKHATRMFLLQGRREENTLINWLFDSKTLQGQCQAYNKGSNAEGAGRRSWVHRCLEVPHFNFPAKQNKTYEMTLQA